MCPRCRARAAPPPPPPPPPQARADVVAAALRSSYHHVRKRGWAGREEAVRGFLKRETERETKKARSAEAAAAKVEANAKSVWLCHPPRPA